jgi:AcrR family transcriptional regulator
MAQAQVPAGNGAAGRRGRRTDGGRAKAAIEQAARRLFAEHGYDRTSLRQVAIAAGVDPMLVTHYFAGKPGLFAAVMRTPVDPATAIAQVLAQGPEHAGERMAGLVLRTLETPESRDWVIAMVRAATSEPEIGAVVRARLAETLLIPLAEAAGGADPEYRAGFLMTQLIGLAVTRYILAVEPLASRPADEVAADLAPTFQRYLNGPLQA